MFARLATGLFLIQGTPMSNKPTWYSLQTNLIFTTEARWRLLQLKRKSSQSLQRRFPQNSLVIPTSSVNNIGPRHKDLRMHLMDWWWQMYLQPQAPRSSKSSKQLTPDQKLQPLPHATHDHPCLLIMPGCHIIQLHHGGFAIFIDTTLLSSGRLRPWQEALVIKAVLTKPTCTEPWHLQDFAGPSSLTSMIFNDGTFR